MSSPSRCWRSFRTRIRRLMPSRHGRARGSIRTAAPSWRRPARAAMRPLSCCSLRARAQPTKPSSRLRPQAGKCSIATTRWRYVRARVPTGRVETLLESQAFETAAIDASASTTSRPFFASPSDVPEEADPGRRDSGPFRDATGAPRPGQTAGAQSQRTTDVWPPRWSDYPLRKPYSPIADLRCRGASSPQSLLRRTWRNDRPRRGGHRSSAAGVRSRLHTGWPRRTENR